jgi:hypothetical protein
MFAYAALQELGERAASAIPELVAFAKRARDPRPGLTIIRPHDAISILGHMGRPGRDAYLSLLQDKDAQVRMLALDQISSFSLNFYMDQSLQAEVYRCLLDPDAHVRTTATNVVDRQKQRFRTLSF